MKFSKLIVGAVIGLNILFTASVLYVFTVTGNEPAVLVGAWFSFTTVELWQLATIKKHRIKKDVIVSEGSEFAPPQTEADCTGIDNAL